jgi:hypothetical protein
MQMLLKPFFSLNFLKEFKVSKLNKRVPLHPTRANITHVSNGLFEWISRQHLPLSRSQISRNLVRTFGGIERRNNNKRAKSEVFYSKLNRSFKIVWRAETGTFQFCLVLLYSKIPRNWNIHIDNVFFHFWENVLSLYTMLQGNCTSL